MHSVVFVARGAIYPNLPDFLNSTAVTLVNGYLGGNGTREQLNEELASLGLSEAASKTLIDSVR